MAIFNNCKSVEIESFKETSVSTNLHQNQCVKKAIHLSFRQSLKG